MCLPVHQGAEAPSSALIFSRAPAERYTCSGYVGAVALDHITVPAGATCTLERTLANGDIFVGAGATLIANGVTVIGNLHAEGARAVIVSGSSRVGGSVSLVRCGRAVVRGARINGDLLFDRNRGSVEAEANRIGGSLRARRNTGGVRLVRNALDGELQCDDNTPAPAMGGNHSPLFEDQFARA